MAQTPKEAEKASLKKETEFTLTDGRVAKCMPAKGKHVMKAQRLMDGDAEKMIPALMSVCTTVDGIQLTMEDFEEMDAKDFMTLMGHFSTAFQ